MMPKGDRRVSPRKMFSVDWYTPLVKAELLDWMPRETARPAVDPDSERVIVNTRDGYVRCLDPQSGAVVWSVKTGSRFYAGASVVNGVAYVPGGDGVLYALRVATGERVWEYRANEELVTVPVVREGKVFVASQAEAVFAVDAATGKWLWQYRREAPSGFSVRGAAQPVVGDGLLYMGFADGFFAALGIDDGVIRWERRLTISGGTQFMDVDSTAVLDDDGHVFAASYKDGLYALSAATGDIVWSASRAGLNSLLIRNGVIFAGGDGALTAIETRAGHVLWTIDLSEKTSKGARGSNAGQAATMLRDSIAVPTSTAVAFVDPTTGKVQSAWNPGRGVTATPLRFQSSHFGSRLFVLSNLGTVYALHLVNGGR